jgi:hypothetical protein
MAIAQPSYPSTTGAVVTHVGSYTDSEMTTHVADTSAVHGIADTTKVAVVNLFNGTVFPSRPVAPDTVLWIGGDSGDDPTASMEDGDIWFPSGA